jgi:hypothetical protein
VLAGDRLHADSLARAKYRCVRFLLPGLADLLGSRGRVNHYRQQCGAPDGYQSVWFPGFSPLRQPDPDLQYLCMVSILRDLTHEYKSPRESGLQSKA